jgi:hypothetical protein
MKMQSRIATKCGLIRSMALMEEPNRTWYVDDRMQLPQAGRCGTIPAAQCELSDGHYLGPSIINTRRGLSSCLSPKASTVSALIASLRGCWHDATLVCHARWNKLLYQETDKVCLNHYADKSTSEDGDEMPAVSWVSSCRKLRDCGFCRVD